MAEERVQRRLAAILAADVVGYSSLMEKDEAGTLGRLQALRAELIDPKITEHGGRIVKTMGDGVLVEFPSAVAAVENALSIQQAMAEHEADRPEENRIQFRVGINLGDVIIEGDDIHGDGVNVAARLEGLCKPGEVYVSGTVHEHVEGKIAARFEDLGQQAVKNISRPVRAFSVQPQSADVPYAADCGEPLALPDKPSIAVLPFENMSGDPEQEYFADGIAEDIITALSKFNWFFVIARNSSFTYKGRAVDVKQVAKELGVQYVLEGSVRKAGNRVRITAQLIDALSGRHIWAERFDRELTDIFAVQDEITAAITGAVAPSFVSAEARRIERRHPENLDAWERAVKGNDHLWRLGRENLSLARRLFTEAIEMDPRNTFARSGLALACSWQVFWDWADDPVETRAIADEALKSAARINNDDAWVHAALCICRLHTRDIAGAIDAGRRALELNPNLALAEGALALSHAWAGNYDDAISHSDKASRLSPRDAAKAWWSLARVVAAFVTERPEEQVLWAKRMVEEVPDHPTGWRFLAAGYAELDRMDEARGAIDRYLELLPHHTVGTFRYVASAAPSKDLTDRLINLLGKAGLPE